MNESLFYQKGINGAGAVILLLGLYLTSLYSFPLFHSLAELFSIIIACGIFMVAWNARSFLDNNYLLFIGIAYLFIAGLDLIHTLSYKGMGIFREYDADLPTQFWIAARYVEAVSLLVAPLFLRRQLKVNIALFCYLSVFSALLLAIFYWDIFPVCFVEGVGLTPFKKASEYIISSILLGAMAFVIRSRREFDPMVLRLLVGSILLTIASELSFTFYITTYGLSNLIGHYFKIISFFLIYRALIETGLVKPYSLFFKSLKQSEEALRASEERFRGIFEQSPIGIGLCDMHGRVMEANRACMDIFGASSVGDLKGVDLLHAPIRSADITRQPLKGEAVRYETPFDLAKARDQGLYRTEKSGMIYLDIVINPFNLPANEAPGYLLQVRDITVHKRAEEALRAAEARYRNLFAHMINGFAYHEVLLDRDGQPVDYVFLEVNDAFEMLTGLKRESIVGKRVTEVIPDIRDDSFDWIGIYGQVALGGDPVKFESHSQSLNKWYSVSAYSPQRGSFVTVFEEITDRKRVEKLREERLARLNALFRVSTDVLAAVSMEDMLQRAVDAAIELTGARVGTSGHGYREGHFRVGATARSEDAPICPPGTVFSVERGGVYLELIEKATSIRLTNEELHWHVRWWGLPAEHAPLDGLLGARLTGRDGEPRGLLMVSHKRYGNFTEEDEILLKQLASLTSLGMQHFEARLELARQADELRDAHDAAVMGRRHLETILETIPVGVVILDAPHGRIGYVNPSASALYGTQAANAPGMAAHAAEFNLYKPDGELFSAAERPADKALIQGETVHNEEVVIRHSSGLRVSALASAAPLRNGEGEIIGAVGVFREITALKRMENELRAARDELELRVQERTAELVAANHALRQSEELIRTVLEILPVGLWLADEQGRITYGNAAAHAIWGTGFKATPESYKDYRGWWVATGNFMEPDEWALARAIAAGEKCIDEEVKIHCFDGSHKIILNSAVPLLSVDGKIAGAVVVNQDITERKKSEEALRESESRCRRISGQLLVAQENERKLIAQDIHDSLGSSLAAIKFRAEAMAKWERERALHNNFLSSQELIPVIQSTIDEVRRIQMALRPAMLDDLGVLPTIGWFCREYEKSYGNICVERRIGVEEQDVPERLKVVVFRILQEALNNVAKHSHADRVEVSLMKRKEGIELTITDNGQGFDAQAAYALDASSRGLGLSGMMERVELSGGTLRIHSSARAGTTIRACWPMADGRLEN